MNYRQMIEDLDLSVGLPAGFDPAMRFMIEACQKMSLSDTARQSLEVAIQYLDGAASAKDLEAARVRCWESIKARDPDFADHAVAATRAVICTLYPRDGVDDLFTTLDVFEDFANAAGIATDDLLVRLRVAFGSAGQPAVRLAPRR